MPSIVPIFTCGRQSVDADGGDGEAICEAGVCVGVDRAAVLHGVGETWTEIGLDSLQTGAVLINLKCYSFQTNKNIGVKEKSICIAAFLASQAANTVTSNHDLVRTMRLL